MTITQFMTADHRACDEQLAQLENIVDQGNFDGGKIMWEEFQNHMLKHFDMEEKVMFPQFTETGGGHCDPTGVMVMEHDQMRQLFSQMQTAIDANDKNGFLGASETLLFTMQQHNMKEEQMMYTMADDTLDSSKIVEEMKAV